MKSKQKTAKNVLPDIPTPVEIADDADIELDKRLDALDVIEAERRMADPNDESLPFEPYGKRD